MTEVSDFLTEQEQEYSRGTFNPLEFRRRAKQILDVTCRRGGQYDPCENNVEGSHNQYTTVATFLFKRKFTSLGIEFLVEWWNELAERQMDRHVYRAATSMQLARFFFELGDRGAALRWALLTHADDILRGTVTQGAGVQILRGMLGMTEIELRAFEAIARQNKESAKADYSIKQGFAEDIIVRFALENPGFAPLFAYESSVSEFPLSTVYFGKLLELACAPVVNNNTTEKGRRLEDLASYLFLLIPGWVPRRNMEDQYKTFENDIVVRNFNRNAYIVDLVGRYFLVECKNWSTKQVKSPDVGYFLHRMQLSHAKFGVIFAWSGTTGEGTSEPEEENARNLIRKTFHETGNLCVTIEQKHLMDIAEGKITFWSLLLERIEEFRFGNSKSRQN